MSINVFGNRNKAQIKQVLDEKQTSLKNKLKKIAKFRNLETVISLKIIKMTKEHKKITKT